MNHHQTHILYTWRNSTASLACFILLLILTTIFSLPILAVDGQPAIQQEAYIKASNTDQWDGFGISVAVSGNTLVVGARDEDSNASGVNGDQDDSSATDSGAVYVFTRSGTVWTQQAYLKASNTNIEDLFGLSVSISGDTLVVGVRYEDSIAVGINGDQNDNSSTDSGAAYVFTRSGTTWSQQAYIKASNTDQGDAFGRSVSVSSETLVVGAAEDSNATGINGDQANNSAEAAGAAYVFTRNGTIWSQQAYLKASNTDGRDLFGYSVSISGEALVVAAPVENSATTGINGDQGDNSLTNAGAVYVFTRSDTEWSQQAYIKASNTDGGDVFGWSVAISEDALVVGSEREDSNATDINGDQGDNSARDAGAAYVFTRSGTVWTQQDYIKSSNTDEFDYFGWYVAISGSTVVVSATGEESNATGINGDQSDNSLTNAGAVYVYSTGFQINPGLNDAWYNPDTDGQGFFITVFPDLGYVSLAWFTYDTELPAEDATANLGDPGHRWLTAVGPIEGNQAIMEIEMTSGGLFDTTTLIDRTDPPGSDGTIILTFTSCNSATIEYDIPSINRQGTVPIQRVADDNIVICEALNSN